jgi:hypothetical protein
MLGAISEESTGLSFVRVIVSSNKSLVSMYIIFTVYVLLTVHMYCSVKSRCYATIARWADIPWPFLGSSSVNTFPLLGNIFLIMQ